MKESTQKPTKCHLIILSVSAILKRCEDPDDYTTQGWTWFYEIK